MRCLCMGGLSARVRGRLRRPNRREMWLHWPPMRPGAVAANRLQIEEIAGTGGMGTVYRARDIVAGGNVALKTLAGIGERDAARFAREAAVLAELVHPGIVRYIAHGLTADHEH